jgi:anti-sigma factor ChrR (cupin superfamily)
MKCVAPNAISEEQLLAYVDGEADEATIAHIQCCAHCAQRVQAYAADQALLHVAFHRIECPDAHSLAEYQQGLLSPSEQTAIEDHLKMCLACSKEIADLNRFLQDVSLVPISQAVVTQLKRIIARKIPTSTDAVVQQPTFALRGATSAAPDVYQADDIKLVVGLEADGLQAGRKMILGLTSREGQSLASFAGAKVQLRRGETTVAAEEVDSLGNFVFTGLLSGDYELILTTSREQVVVETIVV